MMRLVVDLSCLCLLSFDKTEIQDYLIGEGKGVETGAWGKRAS